MRDAIANFSATYHELSREAFLLAHQQLHRSEDSSDATALAEAYERTSAFLHGHVNPSNLAELDEVRREIDRRFNALHGQGLTN
jgi:hypothetical protein